MVIPPCVTLLALIAGTLAASDALALPNPGFEQDGAGIPDWRSGGAVTLAAGAAAGQRCALLRPAPGANAWLGSAVLDGVEPGATYELRFQARAADGGQALVEAQFYSEVEAGKDHWWKARKLSVGEGWTACSASATLPAAADWQGRRLTVRLVAREAAVAVDAVAVVRCAAPAGGHEPLVNGGFELGWTGWGIDHVSSDLLYRNTTPPSFDRDEHVDGAVGLRLPPQNCVMGMRHPARPGVPLTASWWAKARTTGAKAPQVTLITPHWDFRAATLAAAAAMPRDWTRYQVTLTPRDRGNPYANTVYLRVDSNDSELLVDGFRLDQGEAPGADPLPPQAAFRALAPLGVYRQGQPGRGVVTIHAPGALALPARVLVEATSASGSSLWRQEQALTALDPQQRCELPLEFPTTRLGVAEVAMTLVDAAGARHQLPCGGRVAVIDAGEVAPHPVLGLENRHFRAPAWAMPPREELGRLAGTGFSRLFPGGPGIEEPASHPAELAAVRAMLHLKKQAGQTVMVCMGEFNHGSPLNWQSWKPLAPAELDAHIAAFARQCAGVAAGLGDDADWMQVLNEVNIWRKADGADKGRNVMPPELYARVLREVAAAVRPVAPHLRLATSINGVDFEYAAALLAQDLGGAVDGFGVNAYRRTPEDPAVVDDYARLRALIDRHRPGLLLFNTEQYFGARLRVGRSTESEWENWCDSEAEQGARMLQTWLHHAAAGNVPFASMIPEETVYRLGDADPVRHYFVFTGMRHFARLLAGAQPAGSPALHPALRTFLFTLPDGRTVASLAAKEWGTRGSVRLGAPADAATDCDGNPVASDPLAVDALPSYLVFARGRDAAALLAGARIGGFGFPISLAADCPAPGQVVVSAANQDANPHQVVLTCTGPAAPAPIRATLAPGEARSSSAPCGPLPWDRPSFLSAVAAADGVEITRQLRLPALGIPPAPAGGIRVDGELGDWAGLPGWRLGAGQLSADFAAGARPHQGPADLAATLRLAWDEGGLHLAADIDDDVAAFGEGPENQAWGQDSLQVYLDLRNDGGEHYRADDTAWTLLRRPDGSALAHLDQNPNGRYVGAANANRGIDRAVAVAFRPRPGGYVVEAAFPAATMPFLTIALGAQLGLAVLINDNDGAGRKQGLVLGPVGGEPHPRPAGWQGARLLPR